MKKMETTAAQYNVRICYAGLAIIMMMIMTENARHETTAQSKMQCWKLREIKRHQNTGVETATNGNWSTMM